MAESARLLDFAQGDGAEAEVPEGYRAIRPCDPATAQRHVDNVVITSHYTAVNFVPKFLVEQFSRFANAVRRRRRKHGPKSLSACTSCTGAAPIPALRCQWSAGGAVCDVRMLSLALLALLVVGWCSSGV